MTDAASRRRASSRSQRTSPDVVEHEAFSRAVEAIMRMLTDHVRELEALREEQRIQFKRIAQLQAELDSLKKAFAKITSSVV